MKPTALILAAVLATGCASLPKSTPSDPLIGAWTVTEIDGAPAGGPAGMTFEETRRVAGDAGCNRFMGAYSFDAATGGLVVTPLGVTRRFCPEPQMSLERQIIARLQEAHTATRAADGSVMLTGPAGKLALRRPSAARALAAAKPAPTLAAPTPQIAAATPPLAPAASTVAAPSVLPAAPPPSTSDYGLAGGPGGQSPTVATPAPAMPTIYAPSPVPAPATASVVRAPPATPVAPAPQQVVVAAAPVTPVQPVVTPPPLAATERVTAQGDVYYRAPTPLPADAQMRVQLRATPRAGGGRITVLAEQAAPAAQQTTFPFSLSAPASIVPRNSDLGVVAQIVSGAQMLFISDTVAPSTGQRLAIEVIPAVAAGGTARPSGVLPAPSASTPKPVTPAPTPSASVTPAPAPAAPPVWTPAPAPPALPGAVAYRCGGDTFQIAFEERVALLLTADGAIARLARIDASEDPGTPRLYSNSILTLMRDRGGANGGDRVRFARGRAALGTCTPGG